MRVALMFQRFDVDGFKDEADADQWAEWQTFAQLEPQGFHGMERIGRRIAYVVAQASSRKRLNESRFALRFIQPEDQIAYQNARWEMMAIESEIREKLAAEAALEKQNHG